MWRGFKIHAIDIRSRSYIDIDPQCIAQHIADLPVALKKIHPEYMIPVRYAALIEPTLQQSRAMLYHRCKIYYINC